MVDVEVNRLEPLGPLYAPGRRRAGTGRPPLLVGGAFLAAIVVGVVIGLVTAPHSPSSRKTHTTAATQAPADASPPLPRIEWATQRAPGTAHNMHVRPVDRGALQSSLAAFLRGASGEHPTTAEVTIPTGYLWYGAIEGASADTDVYWAVGKVVIVNGSSQSPQVWKRVGAGPWTPVARGPGACDQLPSGLYQVWQGRPGVC